MCVASAVMDDRNNDWTKRFPQLQPVSSLDLGFISRAEFEVLKRELEELKALLKAAKVFDEATGQPECESEQKTVLIKTLAKALNVDLEDIFPIK